MYSDPAFPDRFNDVIAKYAMSFAQPLFFGDSPAVAYSNRLNNATASLIKLQGRYLAVTCQHVLHAYRVAKAVQNATIFQIGRAAFQPLPCVLSESKSQDLVVLDVSTHVGDGKDLEPGHFYDPGVWPPATVSQHDLLAFAGFPGVWREQLAVGHLRFYSFTSGTAEVETVGEYHLTTRLALEGAEVALREGLVLGSLGGLSGGPVFVWRLGAILQTELIGFAKEYQQNLDILHVRRASCLLEDGQIVDQPI